MKVALPEATDFKDDFREMRLESIMFEMDEEDKYITALRWDLSTGLSSELASDDIDPEEMVSIPSDKEICDIKIHGCKDYNEGGITGF